jgi:hypothetical protein
MMGEITNPKNEKIPDLDRREIGICVALAVMIFWVGLYPIPFLKVMDGSIDFVTQRVGGTPVIEPAAVAPTPAGLYQFDSLEESPIPSFALATPSPDEPSSARSEEIPAVHPEAPNVH